MLISAADFHHEQTVNCYSTSFRHMDWIFGTDTAYHKKRDAQKQAKKMAAAALKAGTAVVDTAVDAGNKVVDAGNKLVEDAIGSPRAAGRTQRPARRSGI